MTDKQLEANRRNARLSSGPRTEEGKAVVASNAYRHGFRAQKYLLPDENPDEFLLFWAALLADYQPENRTEQIYVERMAIAQHRLSASESNATALDDRTLRAYQASLENAFDKARATLVKIQQERKSGEQKQITEAEVKKEARKMVDEALQETRKLRRIEDLLTRTKPQPPANEPPEEIEIAYTDPEGDGSGE